MHRAHLENVDLNLLPALHALLEERNISRAADRIGLSQSAMSRALQRLRRVLDDDLLVRATRDYRLTPRASLIRDQLAVLVPQLDALFSGSSFDPAGFSRTIRLTGSDYATAVVGPALVRQVAAQAPLATVRFTAWHPRVFDDLALGDLDLAFFGAQPPPPLRTVELFTDRFVCLVALDHPLAGRTALTLDDYLSCRHVVIDVTAGTQPAIDRVLAARGTPRDVASILPFHTVAPLTLPGTALMVTLPSLLVPSLAGGDRLSVVPAPPEIETLSYRMAWHPRVDSDPGHRWLRSVVRNAAAPTDSGTSRED
ncbi:LysR family transcriptional regulator [Actinoplanes sp. NPDC051411]|uniref:LysR family transcriptional regulator n=1 Tax=Actinoplanes sp. NPDC051411 TaxID=3155522 RepID=UPI00343D2331